MAKGAKGRKQKYSLGDRKEAPIEEDADVKFDPIAEAEKDFFRIIKEVQHIMSSIQIKYHIVFR